MGNKNKNTKYKDKTRARYNKKVETLNKEKLKESNKQHKKEDKITAIINKSSIVLCVLLVIFSLLYLFKLVQLNIIMTLLVITVAIQQGLVSFGAFREKNYAKGIFSIFVIICFLVAFKYTVSPI
ncbi:MULTISPECIES: hypothetical protein [unclassified Clostridioides]|uniref:hypothetical protein n=1 Tax=unclassified Clostridioides TaxID=2635829 RepID=UPI001D11263D|nr:hypothetical protein [Clostridioides sp. ZZV14-6150]MCC0661445.1 hypothetical protein [Clostridioides sp. ZZV14-6154]MCC0668675.1 hypothetical protein [Clostridioides sp. ZZV14-6153]MCC0717929.1 hypothetical protein [Clostridioides sp. ZZV14-6105]MCC0721985.1 hypothetical protein [Clostridioides sp. ZZV14-6104]MCC0725990.1 hypothetical protein [Clostridioides sp. ZZV14-6045]MCC0731835.1 hypothetical protein [Clostridioides sp. ZZV14-6048]MCC0735163.1 hypothetical protein [Clostridioides s